MKLEKGTRVRIKASEIDSYRPEVARKIRDRVGEVYGFTFPYGQPMVRFPAAGRRKEFRLGGVDVRLLEIAE